MSSGVLPGEALCLYHLIACGVLQCLQIFHFKYCPTRTYLFIYSFGVSTKPSFTNQLEKTENETHTVKIVVYVQRGPGIRQIPTRPKISQGHAELFTLPTSGNEILVLWNTSMNTRKLD